MMMKYICPINNITREQFYSKPGNIRRYVIRYYIFHIDQLRRTPGTRKA